MTKPHKISPRDAKDIETLSNEIRRLVDEADASGFEPYEGAEAIKAAVRRKLSKR